MQDTNLFHSSLQNFELINSFEPLSMAPLTQESFSRDSAHKKHLTLGGVHRLNDYSRAPAPSPTLTVVQLLYCARSLPSRAHYPPQIHRDFAGRHLSRLYSRPDRRRVNTAFETFLPLRGWCNTHKYDTFGWACDVRTLEWACVVD